jgi:acetyltransferase
VDLAVAVVPRDKLDGVVRDVAASQTRHLIVATAGFADLGPAGMDLQKRLLGRARAAGVRVMGPNSIGVINTSTGLATSFTTLHPLRRGTVGLFGQTGTFASGYANWFASNGHTGVSKIACIGNKGHTDEADLLEYFARDPSVNVIGMYTEGVSNPAFLRRLREMAGRKPLCVLRAGKTAAGRRIVATHTGSLVGEDRVFRAAFRETGVVEVEDIDELFLTLSAFENLPPPRAARVAVVSITGIGCVLSAEGAAAAGVDLVQLEKETLTQINRLAPAWAPVHNPFDIWAMIEKQGAEKAYRATALPAFEDPNVDALMLIFVLIEESRFDVGALIAELRARQPQKPILFTVLGGSVEAAREWIDAARQGGALYVCTPAAGMHLLARMERFSRFSRNLISE